MHIKNFDPYDFSKKKINGVPVYYKNLPWAPCIHIRVVFNTGAFDDPVGKEGLSHFFEHMIFDGSPTLPDKKAIREWQKIYTLNTWNAWTNFDNTNYWLKCLPEKYEDALIGMKDMIFHSLFRPEDVEHERKVITQEAWNRFQNEKFLAYSKEFSENLFHGNSHSRFSSPLGWPETITKISREDIVSWHKKNYGIGNFFIVLVGAVEEKHIEYLKEFLKDLPKAEKISKNFGLTDKPKQQRSVKTADEIGEVKEQVEISFVRIAEKLSHEKSEISSIFAMLTSDILHERLREEKSLCYNVRVQSWTEKKYSQIFMNVKTEEKNIDIVEKEFKKVLDEIADGKLKAKFEMVKKVYFERMESDENLSGDIADDTLREISKYDGHIITQAEQLAKIEKVKYEDVAEFAKWAFDPEYVYTEIILPSKK
jgi:predicted Zn-dependent peptidase